MASKPYVLPDCDACAGGGTDGLTVYGSFSSSVTQPVVAGTPLALTYDTRDLTTTPGVTVVLSPASSRITVSTNGVYTVLTSIQVDQTTTLNDLQFYVSINGTAVPNSASRLALTPAIEDVFTIEWMLELVAGDYVEVFLSTLHAGFRALAIAAAPPVPLIPSVITVIKRIAPYTPPPFGFTVANALLGTDYTITTGGGRTYYNFLAINKSPAMTITNTVAGTVDYFAIGGGGGSAGLEGGGGGAGGLQQATGLVLPAGTRTITIGVGGIGVDGGNTIFGAVTALGGGKGGGYNGDPDVNGGCGGGGVGYNAGSGGTGSQGGNGGNGAGVGNIAFGGGGGGVSGNGRVGTNTSGSNGGDGGVGMLYNNGTVLQLGGGGGGGCYDATLTGAVGGAASFGGGLGGNPNTGTSGGNGAPNTGGGAGGAPNANTGGPYTPGVGGSGFFSISYLG